MAAQTVSQVARGSLVPPPPPHPRVLAVLMTPGCRGYWMPMPPVVDKVRAEVVEQTLSSLASFQSDELTPLHQLKETSEFYQLTYL